MIPDRSTLETHSPQLGSKRVATPKQRRRCNTLIGRGKYSKNERLVFRTEMAEGMQPQQAHCSICSCADVLGQHSAFQRRRGLMGGDPQRAAEAAVREDEDKLGSSSCWEPRQGPTGGLKGRLSCRSPELRAEPSDPHKATARRLFASSCSYSR